MNKLCALLCIPTLAIAQQASTSYTPSPIVSAIEKAAEYTGITPDQIIPTNGTQEAFLAHYLNNTDVLSKLSSDEMRSWASTNFDELNTILKNEGFDIRLEQTSDDDVGIVAILKAAIEWKEKAKKINIAHNNTYYDAILLEEAKQGCTVTQPTNYAHPIASVETKSGDTIHFAIADEEAEGFALRDKIELLRNAQKTPTNISSVAVPMVDLNEKQQLDWLLGLIFDEYVVSEAEQQTKFKMNETGAKVESAAVLVIERCCAPTKRYTIDQPFFVWIERPGMDEPYFTAYVGPEDWGNPGNLSI